MPVLQFDILSLFPDYFIGPFSVSILKRARGLGLISVNCTDIRDFAANKWKKVDDRPFGGGPGMLLTPAPCVEAIRSVKKNNSKVVYLSPAGRKLNASLCRSLAKESHLVLLCGHYEGIDERIIESCVDEEVSIGDYVLTSGCPAAAVLVDAVSRFVPGVLGNPDGANDDSFEVNGLPEGPKYTRPVEFEGRVVPEVLRSGNHAAITQWTKEMALKKSGILRSDLSQ